MLNAEQLELLRTRLLLTARASSARGTGLGIFWLAAKQSGFSLSEDQVETHLNYLADKLLLRAEKSHVSAGLNRWMLTANGTDFLEGQSL